MCLALLHPWYLALGLLHPWYHALRLLHPWYHDPQVKDNMQAVYTLKALWNVYKLQVNLSADKVKIHISHISCSIFSHSIFILSHKNIHVFPSQGKSFSFV